MEVQRTPYDRLLDFRAAIENEGIRITDEVENYEIQEDFSKKLYQAKTIGFLAAFNTYYEFFTQFVDNCIDVYDKLIEQEDEASVFSKLQTKILNNNYNPHIKLVMPQIVELACKNFALESIKEISALTVGVKDFEIWFMNLTLNDVERVYDDENTPRFDSNNPYQLKPDRSWKGPSI